MINMTTIALVAPAASHYFAEYSALVAWASGGACVASFLLTPDLDLRHSRATRAWGPLRPIWMLYHLFFTHRGLSHKPILGTISRFIYLAGVVFVIALITQALALVVTLGRTDIGVATQQTATVLQNLIGFTKDFAQPITAVVLGVFFADFMHIAADRVSSLRPKKRRWGR